MCIEYVMILKYNNIINRHGAIRYFERLIFWVKNLKKIVNIITVTPSICIDTGVMLWDYTHQILTVLTLIPVCHPTVDSILFIYLVCALPLSRSIYYRFYNAEKLKKIVNKSTNGSMTQWLRCSSLPNRFFIWHQL